MNMITDTTSTNRAMTATEKQHMVSRIKNLIAQRDLVARRLADLATATPTTVGGAYVKAVGRKQAEDQAFAYVFVQQLLFRGIDSPSLRRELAEMAEIGKVDYKTASLALAPEKEEG